MTIVQEEWRDVPFNSNYSVTRDGKIRSKSKWVKCKLGSKQLRQGRILNPTLHRGYLVTSLRPSSKTLGVHQIVAMTWIGPYPDKMVVNHINGIKTDNRVENLEYVTNEENVFHAYRTGLLSNVGTTNGRATINEATVVEILKVPRSVSSDIVAKQFGCTRVIVNQIRCGKTWKHVPRPAIE